MTVTAAEQHINDTGASTTLTITVLDEAARKGTGVVRVTTKVGLFGEEGNNTLVTLSEGSATVPFTCPAARDSTCALGVASISADWRGTVGRGKVYVGEKGLLLLEGKTGTTVPPPNSGGGSPTETGTFSSFVSGQVYLMGSLLEDVPGAFAVSSLPQPMKHFVGFPQNVSAVSLRPNGNLLYVTGGELYQAVQDPFTQGGTGTNYPSSTLGNDTLLATPCTSGSLSRYAVHPTTGEVYYQCGTGREIKNQTTGVTVVPADSLKGYILLKVGANGIKLVTDTFSPNNLMLLDTGNSAKRVDMLSNPDTSYMQRSSLRTRPEGGFHVVYYNRNTEVLQLWSLNSVGVWAGVGDYPSTRMLPTGYALVAEGNFVLDSNRNAYALVVATTGYAVARFTLGAAAATIVYDEKNRPADTGWSQWPPRLYTLVQSSANARLVTGP
ncbi:hypothetical protein [Archangium sp.]|uniref:hypothetical protein n=1 Tax=Archangium sp. TaxID=1872627 RepID=UPI00286C842C|nr:hypothetical protein [Archangium sp.]